MNIRVLIASSDVRYITRLSDVMSQTPLDTGDVLEVSLFTDGNKLDAHLKEAGKTLKYDIALVDEPFVSGVSKAVSVVLLLTDDSTHDGNTYADYSNVLCVFKYQRVTGIVKKMLLALAKHRKDKGIGDSIACAFYSPQGGCGTSSMAVAFCMAAVRMGVKPLYVSLEYFNGAELFFRRGVDGSGQGLYDVFYIIAKQGGVTSSIDAAKVKDSSGVAFLKKFPMWMEVAQLNPASVEVFINAARAAYEVDIVVLDAGSGFAPFAEKILSCSDEIFIVSGSDEMSEFKLKTFLDKETYFIQEHLNKCNIIYNKVSAAALTESFGCKSVTNVPVKTGSSVAAIAAAAEEHLKGLINPAWKRKETTS
jgi:cellulose biosynthesis protein BcsQ